MKPRNVSVSIIQVEGRIKVWCCAFQLPASMPVPLVCFDKEKLEQYEAARKKIEKAIEKAIAEVDINLDGVALFDKG